MTKDKTSQKLNEGGEKPVSLPPKVKGNLVSGRVWKHQQTTSKKIVKPNRKKGWAKIQEERNRRQNLLLREQALKEEEKRKKEEEAERLKKKREQRIANEKKAEVIQVITDTKKIKRMSKKQLRSIRKGLGPNQ